MGCEQLPQIEPDSAVRSVRVPTMWLRRKSGCDHELNQTRTNTYHVYTLCTRHDRMRPNTRHTLFRMLTAVHAQNKLCSSCLMAKKSRMWRVFSTWFHYVPFLGKHGTWIPFFGFFPTTERATATIIHTRCCCMCAVPNNEIRATAHVKIYYYCSCACRHK